MNGRHREDGQLAANIRSAVIGCLLNFRAVAATAAFNRIPLVCTKGSGEANSGNKAPSGCDVRPADPHTLARFCKKYNSKLVRSPGSDSVAGPVDLALRVPRLSGNGQRAKPPLGVPCRGFFGESLGHLAITTS